MAHIVDDSTAEELLKRLQGRTLKELAKDLGYPTKACGMLSSAIRRVPGDVSAHAERELRKRLQLPPLTPQRKCVGIGGLSRDTRDELNRRRLRGHQTWEEYFQAIIEDLPA